MFFRWKYQDELKKQLEKYMAYQNVVFQDVTDSTEDKNVRKRPAEFDETKAKKHRQQCKP